MASVAAAGKGVIDFGHFLSRLRAARFRRPARRPWLRGRGGSGCGALPGAQSSRAMKDSQIIRRDGLDLVLHVAEGEGPLVFFQHGLCGDAAQPAAVFPADAGARLAVLDCRGHGESQAGPPEGFSIATFADDVAAAIETVSSGPCHRGRHLDGRCNRHAACRAAARSRLRAGHRAARLDDGIGARKHEAQPRRSASSCRRRPRPVRSTPSSLPTRAGCWQSRRPTISPRSPASSAAARARVTAELLTRISRDGPGVTEAQLAALAVPTLVIGHGEDVVHPLSHARHLAQVIPGAKLLEIPPKARGIAAYETAFRDGLRQFLQETLHAPSRSQLV